MAGLTRNEAGPFRLDQVPQPSPNMLDTGAGYRSYDVQRDADVDVPYLTADPISQVRYHVAPEPAATPAIERGLLGVTLWVQDTVDTKAALAELALAGVSPTAVFGVLGAAPLAGASAQPRGVTPDADTDPALTLLLATSQPQTWLGFSDGKLSLLLKENGPGFWERQPGWMPAGDFARWLNELPQLDVPVATIIALTGLAQQTLPVAQLPQLDELASLATKAQQIRREESLGALARKQPDWDRRFASSSLEDGLTLLIEQAEAVATMGDITGQVIVEAADWRDHSHETWVTRCTSAFEGEQPSRITGQLISSAGFGLQALRDKGQSSILPQLGPIIAWTTAYYELRDDDPVRQARRRFAYLRATDADEQSPGRELVDGATVDLSDAMRLIAEDYDQDDFIEGWAGGLQNLLWFAVNPQQRDATAGNIEAMFNVYDALADPPTTWAAERARLGDLARWHEQLIQMGNAAVHRPATSLPNDCARHLRALLPLLDKSTEQLMTRGLIEALQQDEDLSSVAAIAEIEDLARSFDDTGSLTERLDRIDAFAALHVQLGALAWTVAQELGHPLARELAAQADALDDQPALAAAGFFDAATVGAPQCPEGISSRSLAFSLGSWAYAMSDDPAAERQRWLEQSRNLALRAVGQSLPKVAPNDPARSLMHRYVGRQLGGNLQLATRIGVRLSGLQDVAGFPDQPAHSLRMINGAPRWVTDPNQGEPVPLDSLSVDESSWARLSGLGEDLAVARSDLAAARSALSSDRPSLVERQQEVSATVAELQSQVQAGEFTGAEASGAISSLRRESASLDSAIRNYTSRNDHLQATIDGFNEKVSEYNALLFQLNGELAQAWERWTGPATDAATDAWLDSAPLTAQERGARRWLLGRMGAPSPLRVTRPANGADVGLALRYATDPSRGAEILLAAFDERRGHERLHPGETLEQQVLTLFPALFAYMETYGAAALVQNILRGPLQADSSVEDVIIDRMWKQAEWDSRRKGLEKALGR